MVTQFVDASPLVSSALSVCLNVSKRMLGPVLVIFWPESLNFFRCVDVCLGSLADTPTVAGGGASLSARITLTFGRKRQPFGCVYLARLPHSAAVGQVLPGCQL